jgi:hypothetical protein
VDRRTSLAASALAVVFATCRLARLAATLAGLMYGTFFLTLRVPRIWCRAFMPYEFMGDVPPLVLAGSRGGLTSLFVALGMCGGAWIVAGVDDMRSGREPCAPVTRGSTASSSSASCRR